MVLYDPLSADVFRLVTVSRNTATLSVIEKTVDILLESIVTNLLLIAIGASITVS